VPQPNPRRRAAALGVAASLALVAGAAAAPGVGCNAPSASVDAGELYGVFEGGIGADGGRDAAADARPRTAPSASASASASAARPTAAPPARQPVTGTCVPAGGQPNRDIKRTLGRPACRDSQILEWRDGEGSPRYACLIAPRGAETRAPLPLVLWFHAEDEDPTSVDKRTGLRRLGATQNLTGDPAHAGFLVLAVQGRSIFGGKRGRVFDTEYLAADNVDVAAVDHFFDQVDARGLVDKRRVYTLGASTGGQMAATYAMLRADRVAAFAAYAPEPPTAGWSCDASPPPGLVLYRACDAVTPCDGVERWLRSRDGTSAETEWTRLGLVDEEEPSCALRNRCTKNKGQANHARWPKLREDDILAFFARRALAAPGR
jgi:poly(3-hydroxybutyrate) depolymerase